MLKNFKESRLNSIEHQKNPESICFISPSAYGYFNPDISTSAGGAQRQLCYISQNLTDSFDVRFIVGDYGQPETEVVGGVTLHRSYDVDKDTSPTYRLYQLRQLLSAMRRADSDVYIYNGHPKHAAVIYALTALIGREFVYHLANDPNIKEQPEQLPLPLRRLFYLSLDRARVVIAQTDYQQKQLSEIHGVESAVVPNGYLPAENTVPLDVRDYFLWVGRRDPDQKRPHLYLNLAAELPSERFLLASPENNETDYTQQIVKRAQSMDNVTYLGETGPNKVLEYYRDAKAFVSTSAYEGFPNTFLESWRVNTPVLSLSVNPGRFVKEDSLPGFADDDFDQFVELARQFATDVSFRRGAVNPAKQYFDANLTMEKVATQYGEAIAGPILNIPDR